MLRKSKKSIAIVALLAMLMTMLPMGTAFADNTFKSRDSGIKVGTDSVTQLSTVSMEMDSDRLDNDSQVTFTLPNSDFIFVKTPDEDSPVDSTPMDSDDWQVFGTLKNKIGIDGGNYFEFPEIYDGNTNILFELQQQLGDEPLFEVEQNYDYEILVKINDKADFTEVKPDANRGLINYFTLHLDSIYVPDSIDAGNIELEASKDGSNGFISGTVNIGKASDGDITLKVTDTPTFSDDAVVTMRLTENSPNSFEKRSESLKFTLPTGFKWTGVENVKIVQGKTASADKWEEEPYNYIEKDGKDLIFNLNGFQGSTTALRVDIEAAYEVDDESKAKIGDVTAKIGGKTDCDVSEIVVGRYGQYESSVNAGDLPTIIAGQLEQGLAEVSIEESVAESLVNGRTIILTLPSNAKWTAVDTDSNRGARLEFAGFVGSDGTAAKWKVEGSSTSKAATLDLKDMEVVTAPDFEGDLVAEISGSAGISGKVTLAKVVPAVKMSVDNKITVGIGQAAQSIGTITITENIDGALNDDKDLLIDLPDGVSFSGIPTVEVTEGDLEIKDNDLDLKDDGSTEDNTLVIPIDSESTTASTITIKDAKITVNRSVAEGDITAKVKGDAVIEANDIDEIEDYFSEIVNDYPQVEGKDAFKLKNDMIFPNNNSAGSAVIATVGTPGQTSTESKFVIGSTTYSVNGVDSTMDIAPYLKDGRTYLPLRYVGNAMGISDDNITYDTNTQTATIVSGNTIVQATVGNMYLKVNGSAVAMDAAAELVNGRTMVPFRWIAQALGGTVTWDEATQTVTIVS